MCNTGFSEPWEREGECCSWKCAAAAGTDKEQSLEKGKQKGRQQKSVEALMVQRKQREV